MRFLLGSSYPHLPETRGGLQTSTDELCRELGVRGHRVTVLCGTAAEGGRDEGLGYPVVRAADPAAALPGLAAEIGADVIVIQSGRSTATMLAAALDTGSALAVYLHNVELHTVGGTLPPDGAIFYIANSRFAAGRWRDYFGIDCTVLPPVIQPDRYRVPRTGDKILFVNPVPHKGLERVMRLAAENPDLPFLVAASWRTEDDWKALLYRRFGHLANVEWRAATDDVRTLYADSRLLLMPSVWEEAYGRTVIEAQLNGLPCIVSNRGGLPEGVGAGGIVLDLEAPDAVWNQTVRSLYFDIARWVALSEAATANAEAAITDGKLALDAVLRRLADHSSPSSL